MAGYLRRDRRNRGRRIAGLLILAAGAVLILTWPSGPFSGLRPWKILTSLRPLSTQDTEREPGAASAPSAAQLPALRPLSVTAAASRPVGTTEKGRPTPPASQAAPHAATGTAPAIAGPAYAATQGLLATVVSPVTQPATVQAESPHAAAAMLEEGLDLQRQGKLLEARERLNTALHSGLTAAEARIARSALADLADRSIFNNSVIEGDPLAKLHYVTSGDKLSRIARKASVSEDLLAQINGLKNKDFLPEGRYIKVPQGPFHAVISKREHEMYLYLQHVYVRTLRVGLGENGKTPTGLWKVRNHLRNPSWIDPRTHKEYHPDDPANPLGGYWIGLEGIDGAAVGKEGYGIHGTNEPLTIGGDASLGCVRLAPEHIAFVYRLLEPDFSYVVVHE